MQQITGGYFTAVLLGPWGLNIAPESGSLCWSRYPSSYLCCAVVSWEVGFSRQRAMIQWSHVGVASSEPLEAVVPTCFHRPPGYITLPGWKKAPNSMEVWSWTMIYKWWVVFFGSNQSLGSLGVNMVDFWWHLDLYMADVPGCHVSWPIRSRWWRPICARRSVGIAERSSCSATGQKVQYIAVGNHGKTIGIWWFNVI